MARSRIRVQKPKSMSTWINSAALALLLAGCTGIDLAAPIGGANRGIVVLNGAVSVAPPAGYCADPNVSARGGDSAVVLMGRCNATSKALPALMTASIGAAGSGAALQAGPVALTSFFSSDQGRAMLASSGDANDVRVTTSQIEGDALLLQLDDVALGAYWRAILALRGRLVMLSATSVQSVPLAPQDGRILVSKTIASLRKANGEAASTGLFTAKAPAPASTSPAVGAPTLRPMPRPIAATSG